MQTILSGSRNVTGARGSQLAARDLVEYCLKFALKPFERLTGEIKRHLKLARKSNWKALGLREWVWHLHYWADHGGIAPDFGSVLI